MSIIDEIEDEVLKAEVIQLNLTVPDTRSVLNPLIGDFHLQLYYKLLAMEAYTYQASEMTGETGLAGFDDYSPFWIIYSDALMAYVNRGPINRQQLKDFIIGFFCFVSVHKGRGEGPASLITDSDAKAIFTFGDYYEETAISWPLNYFDDYIAEDPAAMPEPTLASAEKLTEASASVAPLWDRDAGKVSVLTQRYADVISDAGVKAAFSNPTAPTGSLTPTEVWDLLFIDLNWQWYIDTFGSDVVIPPRPEDLSAPTEETAP